MKKLFYLIIVIVSFAIISCKTETKTEPVKKADVKEFLGQWTIDIKDGGVGWLEVRQEDKYLDGDLLWIGGSVLPVSNVFLAKDQILMVTNSNDVVRTRDASD